MTFVHTRLALDRIGPGDILEIRLTGEEATENVPKSAAEQGHTVLSCQSEADGSTRLLLRKAGPAA